MGGYGSGRRRTIRHAIADYACILNISEIRRIGALDRYVAPSSESWWICGANGIGPIELHVDTGPSPYLVLWYGMHFSEARARGEDWFALAATQPHLGGVRWWVICRCGRRVAKLYLPLGARYFRCRHCHQLVYQSQQEDNVDRLRRRARKLRSRLGNVKSPEGRPKWMRHETYLLARVKASDLELRAIMVLCAKPLPGEPK